MTAGPTKGPELDYPEKRAVDLRRFDTRDLSLEDIAHDAKRRAVRRPKEIAAIGTAIAVIIAALATGVVKVLGALEDHSKRAGLTEYRLDQSEDDMKKMRQDLDRARLKLERCRCPKEE